jgi:hypothetical protein
VLNVRLKSPRARTVPGYAFALAFAVAASALIAPRAALPQTRASTPAAAGTPKPTPTPCPTPLGAVSVELGLGARPAGTGCGVTFASKVTDAAKATKTAKVPEDRVKVSAFGDTPAAVKVTYTLVAPVHGPDSLVVELYVDAPATGPGSPAVTFRVTPSGTCTATEGTCAVKEATFVVDKPTNAKVWSGVMSADITTNAVFRETPADRPHVLGVRVLHGGAPLALGRDSERIVVQYNPRAGLYDPKPNADTNKIRDGISSFMRSRLGVDGAQNWSRVVRASAGIGQSATDQAAKAKRLGDDLLKANDGESAAKDGFTVTDADVFAFLDLSDRGARSASARAKDALQKDLSDSGAAVTPFALRNIIAPDGAVKIVLRNDGGPGPPWRVLGGVLFDAAIGDDPRSVADGAAALTLRRSVPGHTTSVSAAYSVANRIQTSIDPVNGPFVQVRLSPGVSASFPVPSPRPVHVLNEGIQIADDRDVGVSSFFRVSSEPSRAGSDVFGALRWAGHGSWSPASDPLMTTTARYSVVAGWRATGNDFIAPLGSRVDLSGTSGPFYALSAGSARVGPGVNRESAVTFYQSRWTSAGGLQQYTSRLDVLVDVFNRFGVTGSGTLSAATLALLTRESTHFAVPLTADVLQPVRQGNAGLAWRPPNGELTLQRGYAFLTDCENVASTKLAPKGLPKGTVVPACFPIGRATFTGSARVTSGRFAGFLSYGGPTAVDRTPLLGGAIQKAVALRYTFGCSLLQAAYINRAGYDAYTDVAGSTYGVTLELHDLIRLPFNRQVNVALTYAGSTKIPLGGSAQSKSAFNPSPDLFHLRDAKGC